MGAGETPEMRFQFVVAALCLVGVSLASEDEMASLYRHFDSATKEILSQIHSNEDATEQWQSDEAEDADTEELAIEDEAPVTQILLDEKAHKAAVKASYQSNVKTIYFHLEEIIKKILAHKKKWTNKYNGDLMKIAKEILKHKKKVKKARKGYQKKKGKAEAAKANAKIKNKSWQKAKAKLKQKTADAKKAKKALKGLYLKGLKQEAGEICMIRKIQCMVAKFNGEKKIQKKYCGPCKEKGMWTKITKSTKA